MNLAGALLLGYLFGSAPAARDVEDGISLGVRQFLAIPQECRIVTTLHLQSRGSLLTGMIDAAEVDLFDVDLATLQWPTGVGEPSTGNLRGRVERVKVSFHRATVSGFGVERLSFLVEPVEFNLGKLIVGGGLALESAGPCSAEIVIDPQQVAEYIDGRSETLREVKLALLEDRQVRLDSRVGVSLLSASVEVMGQLEITEGKGLELSGATLRFGGLPVPGLLTRKIMREINPIFGVEEGSFLARIFLPTSLQFEAGKIVIKGEGTAPFLPPPPAE